MGTSGRISQIFAEGSMDSLGQKSIRKLTDLGYNVSWVLEGKGEKFAALIAKQETAPPDVIELVAAYMRLSDNNKARALLDIKYLADREEIDRRPDGSKLPPIPPDDPKEQRVG